MNYKIKNLVIAIILLIVNVMFLFFYSKMERNDVAFALATFVVPFLASILYYWILKSNLKLVRKRFLYFELLFFSSYLILMSVLNALEIGEFHYEMQTVLFITIFIALLSLFFYFKDLLKKN